MRGFEVVKGWEDKDINLPVRKTKYAAGYDIEAAEDTIIPSFRVGIKPVLVSTGIKAYMGDNEYLMIVNRSSNPLKRDLVLANGVGIIDKDYYGNSNNDGHIMFAFYNYSNNDINIKKGDNIGQGIFMTYLISDSDSANGVRIGGFGSTDNNS